MRKFLVLIVAALSAVTMKGQWVDNPSVNTQISDQKGITSGNIKVAKISEDRMYVAWTSMENGILTRLQLLDRDGNVLWKKEGILVNEYPAASYTTDYSLAVDSEGCAIIAYSDTRSDMENKLNFRPHVYKIDQEGNHLWGINGVAIPCKSHQGMRPRIGITNAGSVIVGYSDAINGLFCIQKINEDGTFAWGQNIELPGIMGNFVATGEDDFILTWMGNGLSAQRFDPYGEEVWDKAIKLDNDPNGYVEPTMVPDGEGGSVICYSRAIGTFEHYVCLQRISSDGELMMGLESVTTGESNFKHTLGTIGVDTKNKEITCQWTKRAVAIERIMIKKYDYFGDELWGENGIEIDSDEELGYFPNSVSILNDQSCIIVYDDYQDNVVNSITLAKRLNKDGEVVWSTKLNDVIAPKMWGETQQFNDQLCVFWCDRSEDVFGQNISLDGKLGIISSDIENINTQNSVCCYIGQTLFVAMDQENTGVAELQISNMEGSVVYKTQIVSDNGQVSIPLALQQGTYIASVLQSNKRVIQKFFVSNNTLY